MKRTGTITIDWTDSADESDPHRPNLGLHVRLDDPTPDETVIAILRLALRL